MKKLLFFITTITLLSNYAQNNCATALLVIPGTYTVTAINGTEIPLVCSAGGNGATSGEWYKYTATVNGAAIIDTNLAVNVPPFSDDTRIQVYRGSCGALECWGRDDDVAAENFLSTAAFPVTQGETYYFAFDDKWENAGFDFVLSEDASISCNNTLPFVEDWTTIFRLSCWISEDANNDQLLWENNDVNDLNRDGIEEIFIAIVPDFNSGALAKDDWLFSQSMFFNALHSYEITIKYNSVGLEFVPNESMDILMVDSPSSNATNQILIESISGITPQGSVGSTTGNDPVASAYETINTFSPTTSGSYNLALHATTPAGGDVLMVTRVSITDNGVLSENENLLKALVTIYPTSTDDNFTIENLSAITLNKMNIFDINGRLIQKEDLDKLIGNKTIDVSNLNAGLYFVELISEKERLVKKIIVR
jgi:hypothetical protein